MTVKYFFSRTANNVISSERYFPSLIRPVDRSKRIVCPISVTWYVHQGSLTTMARAMEVLKPPQRIIFWCEEKSSDESNRLRVQVTRKPRRMRPRAGCGIQIISSLSYTYFCLVESSTQLNELRSSFFVVLNSVWMRKILYIERSRNVSPTRNFSHAQKRRTSCGRTSPIIWASWNVRPGKEEQVFFSGRPAKETVQRSRIHTDKGGMLMTGNTAKQMLLLEGLKSSHIFGCKKGNIQTQLCCS